MRSPYSPLKARLTYFWEFSGFQALIISILLASVALLFGNAIQLAHIPYFYMQYLPVNALRSEPFQSIWNLHSQLPLENILFAAIVNIFRHSPNSPTYINNFWKQDPYWLGVLIKQFACLWLINFSLIRTARLYISKKWGYLAGVTFVALPSTMMYFLYPYSALMSASIYTALCATIFTVKSFKIRLLISTLLLAILGLSHNLFSYYTTFPILLILTLELFKSRKKTTFLFRTLVVFIALLPVLWMVKNIFLFKVYNLTSWSGCALAQSVTPLVKSVKSINTDLQDGWKTAGATIQISPDYSPTEKYPSPIALNQRMKGEGIRNWNHISVIKSCESAKDYNSNLLARNPQILGRFIISSYHRFMYTTGRFGSEFNCSGCNFDYEAFNLRRVGDIVEFLGTFPIKAPALRAWYLFVLVLSPFIIFWRAHSNDHCISDAKRRYIPAFIISNILILVMATSLSTIENERMLWMLTPANYIFLLIFIGVFSFSPPKVTRVQNRRF